MVLPSIAYLAAAVVIWKGGVSDGYCAEIATQNPSLAHPAAIRHLNGLDFWAFTQWAYTWSMPV